MKSIFTAILILATAFTGVMAQPRKLPAPDRSGGLTLGRALALRQSEREFDKSRKLPDNILSSLLWAATGINREESGKRTNPTALNLQEISIYVFDSEGVYLYIPADNSLDTVITGDHRNLVAGTDTHRQDFVLDAPVSLVIVADMSRFGERPGAEAMGYADAGIACQNINLFCAANGLATVPRASMDTKGIIKVLGLTTGQVPVLNNPVGYRP